jgi:hypothetical protein
MEKPGVSALGYRHSLMGDAPVKGVGNVKVAELLIYGQ